MRIIISKRLVDLYLGVAVSDMSSEISELSSDERIILAILVAKNYISAETNDTVIHNIRYIKDFLLDYNQFLKSFSSEMVIEDLEVSDDMKNFLMMIKERFGESYTLYDNIKYSDSCDGVLYQGESEDDDSLDMPQPYSVAEIRNKIIDNI